MPIGIIRGPAGAGKSKWYEENRSSDDHLFDVTAIWSSILGIERDPVTKRYPIRLATDPGLRMALYLKSTAIRFAASVGLNGWATTSSSSPLAVERIRERIISAGGSGTLGRIVTVDPGEAVAASRLADSSGELSPECAKALRRWYGRSS